MKILLLHNRYQLAGGEDIVVQVKRDLLEIKGHQVTLLEISNDKITGGWTKANTAVGAIYSQPSKQRVTAEVADFRPDVVYMHNFFPLLLPSVYDACSDRGVPVVQTLHNYCLGCPNALLFRDDKVCEDCLGKRVPWPGIMHGCYRGSRTKTAVVSTCTASD